MAVKYLTQEEAQRFFSKIHDRRDSGFVQADV